MSDSIYYDYDQAYQAYQDMIKANEKINNDLDELTNQTRQLIQRIGGDFADEYEQRVILLQKEIDDVNREFGMRANGVNRAFDEMRETDRALAQGL
jgi:uncharacterized protein YukE